MMLLWACAGVPLGVYNIVENFNIALRIQPQILTLLSLITWIQCKYYGNKWPILRTLTVAAPVAASMGGLECGLIFGLRQAKNRHIEWPTTFMAVLSACLLSAGVLRHYWDIYKEKTVRGISFLFVGIDAMGDLTSLISVCFQPQLDILGLVIYGSELVLWMGVFACGGYCESDTTDVRHRGQANGEILAVNLRPWLQKNMGMLRDVVEEGGTTQGHSLGRSLSQHSSSSSTVFRTATNNGGVEVVPPSLVRLRNVPADATA
jgi:hypothetical protein